ncbi:MAG TPA: rhodanese-like domain-containing protein [Flavobacteriaceae bacterium]|nr:rhodanese-like domain-containing protein [Flavobacteriaceae bacterium]
MKDLTQEQWKELLEKDENAFILDVRTSEEFSEGHIPEARQIDIYQPTEFMGEIEKLDKSKNYYVYCRSGGRSQQACEILDQLGFAETYNLLGGFSEWDGDKEEI